METDRLKDKMGFESILSINVNLMETETDTGMDMVYINGPLET